MANELVRLDGCKRPFQQRKTVSLQAPLDAVEPIGLASMGCTPVVTTLAASNQAIAARVKEENGAYDQTLLTSANSADLSASNPGYSAYVAAFRGDNPIVGTVASPYPVSDITWNFTLNRETETIAVNEKSGFIPFNGGIYGSSPVFGFGGNVAAGNVIVLGGGEEFESIGLYNAYKSYHQNWQVGYVPSGYSLTVRLVSGELQSATATLAGASLDLTTSGVPSTATGFFPFYQCNPVLTSLQGTLVPVSGQPPGYIRNFQIITVGDVTIGGFGSTNSASHTLSGWRPSVVVYASASVSSMTLNGVPGTVFGGSINSIKLPYISAVLTFSMDQSFFWEIDPTVNTFAFQYFAGGDTFTPTPQTYGAAGPLRFWEGLLTLP